MPINNRFIDNNTRRYPRTLNQAFGPYTSNQVEEPRDPNGFRWTPVRIALALTYLAAIVTLIFVIPGGPGV